MCLYIAEMNIESSLDFEAMKANAGEAADYLRALSNRPRLLILCHLIDAQELSVGQLVDRIGISQSALSQHLAKLRAQGMIAYRREAQTLFYRIADWRAERILETLHDLFCTNEQQIDGEERT
ncbi:helix-turn-helix transcriptional regulator [Erythrobacter sp. YT30]|uniref:ArsR/SmtB family transcription factor n=1 Tax=Erythrobacter sp. YT30 TaxID=1735012 RepID=UPI000A6AAB1E|nr:metalloregulator ArsR/SmtB family transcription factor [Erythrobacter sp. YT30]